MADGFSSFSVDVDLTEQGMKRTDDIITMIFQYINMINNEGPQEWVFEECKNLKSIQFRFKDKETPIDYVSTLAESLHVINYSLNYQLIKNLYSNLQNYPIEEVLSAGYLLENFEPQLIIDVLDCLTPDNSRICITAKAFEGQTDQNEKYYGTSYKYSDIPNDKIAKWSDPGLNGNLKMVINFCGLIFYLTITILASNK